MSATEEVKTEDTQEKQKPEHLWKPGQSGNPEGRPKGARSKFGEKFVKDFLEDWEKHGASVLERSREKSPDGYLRAACAVLPKVIELDDDTKEILKEALSSHLPFDKIREKSE